MDAFAAERLAMVERDLRGRGIRDERVLDAMAQVPREVFVPMKARTHAYSDRPLPIGKGQTISQPYVVAMMIEALELTGGERVLEVGTGSGYAAAVLGRIAEQVYTIERHPSLVESAADALVEAECHNVEVRSGDGTLGWPDEAPFDGILVSAGGRHVPDSLVSQLAPGGRLVIPVGTTPALQELVRIRRQSTGELTRERLGAVRFVPLIGREGWGEGGWGPGGSTGP